MEMGRLSRRGFITGLSASLAAFRPIEGLAAPAVAKYCQTAICVSPKIPDFEKLGTKPEMLARYRPHRRGTYRLETQPVAGKWIVHNYGHSGAGITMSLGCAEQVVKHVKEIIEGHGTDAAKPGIAVLGGGVMGLTAARALVKQYFPTFKIDVYTDKTYKDTTSHVAGGQWAPSSVKWNEDDDDEVDRFKKILTDSKNLFTALGAAYGVSPRTNFTLYDDEGSGLEIAHKFGLIPKDPLAKLPFAKMNDSGFAYRTLLVEPPIFLSRIHNELVAKITNQRFHFPHSFADRKPGEPMSQDIAKLNQKIIVNCTGLGAGKLFHDPQLKAHKGQLVLLPPKKLDYLFSGYKCGNGWAQYMFPRADHLILGGTYQGDDDDYPTPHEKKNVKVGIHIASSLRQLFDDGVKECAADSPDQLDTVGVV